MQDVVSITDEEFELFRRLIHRASGISLTEHKRPLLCARLARRLRHLSMSTFSEYYEYLRTQDPAGDERRELINCVTTNKTEFFREPHHFDFLREHVIAPRVEKAVAGGPRRLRIWSAACSTGEEPYSIAMTVADALPQSETWDVRILASDIDTDVLAQAQAGRYPRALMGDIPAGLRRWCHPVNREEFEIAPRLRDVVTFREINFVREPWPIKTRFDVIFCRNVMIYFERETQVKIYQRFHELLRSGGFLVAGHSENLMFMAPLFEAVGNTVYERRSTGRTRTSLQMQAVAPRSLQPSTAVRPRAAGGRGVEAPGEQRGRALILPAGASLEPGAVEPSIRPRRRADAAPDASQPHRTSLRARPSVEAAGPSRPSRARSRIDAAAVLMERTSVSPRSTGARGLDVTPASRPLTSEPALQRISLAARSLAPVQASKAPGPTPQALERVHIQSGEIYAADRPVEVVTLLGSCVAACLFDPERSVGGMNHFMLPSGGAREGLSAVCFGTNAMELLINELLRLGARRERLRARAYGGAHVLGAQLQASVGDDNARFIRAFLEREGIPLESARLGGEQPLHVSFETHSGRVRIRAVGGAVPAVANGEAKVLFDLDHRSRALDDGVTLF